MANERWVEWTDALTEKLIDLFVTATAAVMTRAAWVPMLINKTVSAVPGVYVRRTR